ncbi:MAG: DUF1499 domain-containing protein [Mariprofundaceae bacterium]|nr:DUF1499 domain-containing protein [Mariprofundaceae bacterium]
MKSLVIIVFSLLVVIIFALIVMAVIAQNQPKDLGLFNGALRPCPNSPNCVCSEAVEDLEHIIQPIKGNQQTWWQLKNVVIAQGGVIQTEADDYMHAEFTTAIFHFVDDVEFHFDRTKQLIHMRSASRIGHADFGVNRKRILVMKQELIKKGGVSDGYSN